MIFINLAKQSKAKNASALKAPKMDFGGGDLWSAALLRLILIILFPLGAYIYEDFAGPEQNEQLEKKVMILTQLQSEAGVPMADAKQLEDIQNQIAQWNQKTEMLNKMSTNRNREIKLVDSIQQDIPERVWLTRIDLANTGKYAGSLLLAGVALNDAEITNFIEKLQKNPTYASVQLIRSGDTRSALGALKTFDIECKMNIGGANE